MRRFREERIAIALLASAAVVLSVLAVLLIRGARSRETLLLEYQAERAAGSLLDAYRNGSFDPDRGDNGVRGFGLYGLDGEAVVRQGTAPLRLSADDVLARRDRFIHDPAHRTVSLLRPIGPASMRSMMGMPGRRVPGFGQQPGAGRQGAGGPAFLFVELGTEEYWRVENRFRAASFLTPVAIAAIAALAGYLYWMNAGYRRRMVAQDELARLGEVARTLAHEIKNPLGAIRLQTGILKRTVGGDGLREIALIEEEVTRLALLSDRIATFLRDPRGDPRPIDIEPFVTNLLARFGDRVRFQAGAGTAGAQISFDPDRLRSVLENLVSNALESGTSEPPQVTVTADPGRVEVAVLDRGAGIAPEDSDRVFDPFFTRKIKGSGVGLAIARRFVDAAGAELRLEPRDGGGTSARLLARRVPA